MTNTLGLIETARSALVAFQQAESNLQLAVQARQAAKEAMDSANLALHDDLATNGPALYVDESTAPPTYLVYTAAEPDTYTAIPIRVAA